MISIDGQLFDESLEHFSFKLYKMIEEMGELKKLVALTRLRSASFCDTNLDDQGLEFVTCAATLENLNLQNTKVTDGGLGCLRRLPRLAVLRLKDNRQLTNACIPHLVGLENLADIQIHETSIDQDGLKAIEGMRSLTDVCLDVWDGNFSYEFLLELSARMPGCTFLAKGRGEFTGGQFSGVWR